MPDLPQPAAVFIKEGNLLKSEVAAALLGCSSRHLTGLARQGKIAHVRYGKKIYFLPEHVTAFLERHTVAVFIQPATKPLSPMDLKLGRF